MYNIVVVLEIKTIILKKKLNHKDKISILKNLFRHNGT